MLTSKVAARWRADVSLGLDNLTRVRAGGTVQRHFTGAVSRVYYAAFHAARALLATKTLHSSRHSGVIALFQEHSVRSGLVSTDVARALPRAFEKRQTSDDGDFSEPTSDEVLSLRDQEEAFVSACEKLLQKPA